MAPKLRQLARTPELDVIKTLLVIKILLFTLVRI